MMSDRGHQARRVRQALFRSGSAVVFLTVAFGLPISAAAAESGGAAPQMIEELVVTAEKRQESLQDIPASISAFSGDRIAQSGARSIVDVQFLAAGLNFGQDRAGVLRTSIRGISSNVGPESAVAVHLDGVYLGNRYDQVGAFFDVKRMEVLRGPQGTLYGRNATGGALNIITNDPTASSEAGAQITYGNYSLLETEGYASGPLLGDRVLGRVAFKTSDLPGYGRNLFSGEKVNGNLSSSGRAKLDIRVTDDLIVKLSADYARNQSTYADEVSRIFSAVPLMPEARGQFEATGFDSNRNRANYQDARAWGGSAKVEWDLGYATVTSLTGYRRVDKDGAVDIDGTPEDAGYWRTAHQRNNEVSQEVNVASAAESKLRWIVGAFYYRNNLGQFNDIPLPLLNSATASPEIFSNLISYRTNAYAFYGQATYPIFENLKLTLGGRYSDEKNHDLETRQVLPGAMTTLDASNSSHAFTPRVSLEWHVTDDVNAYATYAKGFKSGGFNPGTNDPSNFRPEHVANYEVGLKSMFLDRRVLLNLAAFYMKYDDLQVSTRVLIPPGTPATRVVNAASATIKGVEAEFRASAGAHLSFDGNLAYLDARYDDFNQASDPVGATTYPFDVPPGARARSATGNQMMGAPKWSVNAGAEYAFDLADWEGAFRLEYAYQSTVYFTPWEDLRGAKQGPAGVINARLTLNSADEDWSVSFWGRNLTDERIYSNLAEFNDGAFTGLFRSATYRPPRTFGVTVGKHF